MATLSTELLTLGRYLAGEFENRQQSLAEPAWYVHLKVWHRPIRLFHEDSLTFFIEQVSVASGQPPYRQRILRLYDSGSQIKGQYYGLKDAVQVRGGATAPQILDALTPEDLVQLPTCSLSIESQALPGSQYSFKAELPAGTLCSFEYAGNTSYVSLGFSVGPASNAAGLELRVYDKGVDPDTGKGLWGALMGPFCLIKMSDFENGLLP
ncbi:MAG: chromophore lyase CpcT/CpeT [Cyanobacteria bacterium Co-bin13]|nr:chromophore lyase CpcT/CpeT [Cyanobacteria bacterium Co-bin13]